MRRAPLLLLGLLLALFLGPRSANAEVAATFTIAPAAAWVVREEPDLAVVAKEGDARDGVMVLLSDVQRRVDDTVETYSRRTRRLLTAGAVEKFAQVSIEFRPEHEKLVIHGVRIHRGAATIDALRREKVKVIQQEAELDSLLYQGTLTALLILDDVRVGDALDVEYSLVGSNPVFGGKAVGDFDLSYEHPVHRLRRRLLAPSNRPIVVRVLGPAPAPRVTVADATREWSWDLRDVAGVVSEGNLPAGYEPNGWAQFSEFATWRDVIDWAKPMYAAPHTPSAALQRRIDEIRAASSEPAKRAVAALEVVQSDIRYLGIELGESSHRPETPSNVFERRFGDCKDKALLLVTMLRGLDIEALPAFVNTSARGEIEGWLPSPLAFNHVIVRATLGGREYWLDGTASEQHGSLTDRETPPFQKALVVGTVDGLTAIPHTPLGVPLLSVEESFVVRDYQSPVKMQAVTVLRGRRADGFRRLLAEQPASEIARSYLNSYAKHDPDVVQDAPPTFDDDRVVNTVTIRESYTFPSFWKGGTRNFAPYALFDSLHKPGIVRRTMPLGLTYPVSVTHVTRITFPGEYSVERESRGLSDENFRFRFEAEAKGNVVVVRHELETLRDTVPVAGVTDFLKMIDRIDESLDYTIDQRAAAAAAASEAAPPVPLRTKLSILGAVVGFVIALVISFRVRSALARRRARGRAGESPANALVVRATAEVDAALAKLRCDCGAPWSEQQGERLESNARFEERTLTAIRRRCGACGAWIRCWFDDRSAETSADGS